MELYRIIQNYFKHVDSRGSLVGLINIGSWGEVNIINSDAGTIRGGHYHKATEECFFILSGKILVKFRMPVKDNLDLIEEVVFNSGDVFIVHANVEHTFEVLEDSQWINLLDKPLDKEAPDFYRYKS